jgi:hypothetical protein
MIKIIISFSAIIILLNSCAKNSEYTLNDKLSPDDIIKFSSITPTSIDADSNSQIIIRVQISPNTDSTKTITLSTNKGILNGKSATESLTTNLNRYVDFSLTAGQIPGSVSLRASVSGTNLIRDTLISFNKAYPDSLWLKPTSYSITKNSEVSINVNLFKVKGYPSKNQTILFSSTDLNGNQTGNFFTNDTFNPGATLAATFKPDTDFVGVVNLKVTVVRDNGTTIVNSAKIDVQ